MTGEKTYSQRGEDGILAKIVTQLKIQTPGWCCEFGAWDGIHLSNVYRFIKEDGWSGVMIEANLAKFKQLEYNMQGFPVWCYNNYVNLDTRLNSILAQSPIPEDFDVLSMDIDSYDYWVWASLTYDPKIVILEYNSNWAGRVTVPYDPAMKFDQTQYYGASAAAFEDLGEKKGYELVAVVPYINLIFVKKGLNQGHFPPIDLGQGGHIMSPHYGPMTEEQEKKLIYNPAYRWEDQI